MGSRTRASRVPGGRFRWIKSYTHAMNEAVNDTLASRAAPAPAAGEAGPAAPAAPTAPALSGAALDSAIARATQALLALQQPDGHWVFELEADCTIPAEYVLLRHYLAEPVDAALEAKIAVYLRRNQGEHGGWPLFRDGAFDMSATVKAYFALKTIGDYIDAPHMARAREAIRARGGASHANVFTRIMLALFGFI